MDNRHRDRDWPNLVGRRDVKLGPRGRLRFARDIGRAISAAPDHPALIALGYFVLIARRPLSLLSRSTTSLMRRVNSH